ncbi:MAG: hypothetical protein WAM14_17430 [Candidatus Nitrosopolaris sp.]
MYKNAYLTFAATPCKEKAQDEKRAMDRIIVAASPSLLSLKTMIEAHASDQPMTANSAFLKVCSIYDATQKLINKIMTMMPT